MSLFLPPLLPSFEVALRDVRAKDARMRELAVLCLRTPDAGREEEARDALLVVTHDKESRLRALAIEELAAFPSEVVTRRVLDVMDDEAVFVREAAVRAAALIDDARTRSAIERALTDTRPEMRFAACEAIALASPARTSDALVPMLDDADARVAARAAEVLGVHGAPHVTDALARALTHADFDVRANAAVALAHFEDKRAIPVLRAMLDDKTWAFAAADALGRVQATDAREALFALGNKFFAALSTKAAAAGALVRLGDPRGVPMLRGVLQAFRPEGRSFAAELVATLDVAELVPEVIALIDRPRGASIDTVLRALMLLAQKHPSAQQKLDAIKNRNDGLADHLRSLLAETTP